MSAEILAEEYEVLLSIFPEELTSARFQRQMTVLPFLTTWGDRR